MIYDNGIRRNRFFVRSPGATPEAEAHRRSDIHRRSVTLRAIKSEIVNARNRGREFIPARSLRLMKQSDTAYSARGERVSEICHATRAATHRTVERMCHYRRGAE